MRLKSKGLGKKELVMDFREYTVVREGDELVVVGTIRDPINWDFTIRMCEDDLAGLARPRRQSQRLWAGHALAVCTHGLVVWTPVPSTTGPKSATNTSPRARSACSRLRRMLRKKR